MSNFRAIAAVTRTLRTLLRDRMEDLVPVTIAPPDVVVTGFSDRRLNLYLYQVTENGYLRNDDRRAHSDAYGAPPLSLELLYLLTAHGSTETGPDSDLEAQSILGDSMRVLHDLPIVGRDLLQVRLTPGDPVLALELLNEFEQVKITLHHSTIEEMAKIWTALPQANFRRSVSYEVNVVQLDSARPRRFAAPVQQRALRTMLLQRPEITDAFKTPVNPGDPEGDFRLAPGDSLTIEGSGFAGPKTWVRIGTLEAFGVAPLSAERIVVVIPDTLYPIDFDHAATRPIPPQEQLAGGQAAVEVQVERNVDIVTGGLDRGTSTTGLRRSVSNQVGISIVPSVTSVNPTAAPAAGTLLTVNGHRLFRRGRQTLVLIGEVSIEVREPVAGDPWAIPTDTSVQVPLDRLATDLPTPPPGGTQFIVRVLTDGVQSLETGVTFRLTP